MSRLRMLVILLICAFSAVLSLGWMALLLVPGKPGRFLSVAVGFDQTGNATFAGWPDETVSARAHRCAASSPMWARLERLLDKGFGAGHCRASYESERRRAHVPPEERI